MTKGAVANFIKGLAKDMVERVVRMNAVAPGPFWTVLEVSGGQTPENVKKFGTDTPLGRPGQPAEIAHVYVQLALSESSYITGQVYGKSDGNWQPQPHAGA